MPMMKVGIFGVPRSGTSWLGHIFNSHPCVAFRFQPLFSYGHKGKISENSSAETIRTFFEEILSTQDAFVKMKTETQNHYPSFEKVSSPTHIVFKETRYLHVIENMLAKCGEIKIIGIVRNPLAVIASWMQAPKEFDPEWDIAGEWREAPKKNQDKPEEFFGFNKWKEIAEAFLRFETRYPRQFILAIYNELNKSPLIVTKKLFDFCALDVCAQVRDFLAASKSKHDSDPYSVFRGQATDDNWQNILPVEIVRQIKLELKNTPLDIFL